MQRVWCSVRTGVVLFLFSILTAGIAFGQPNASTLTGKVLDSSRAPIPGARVTAVSFAGAARHTAVTDARGEFTLTLPDGDYTLTVLGDGFMVGSRRISVPVASNAPPLEFVLQVGGLAETVEVNAPGGIERRRRPSP